MNETQIVALVLGICLALFLGLLGVVFIAAIKVGKAYDERMKELEDDSNV